jgi:tetratricopeptide (TPR) repeat protein
MIETKKAHELDIVELIEDLPEFGLRRGERGTVLEVFDNPEEAYVLEFINESGESSKLAYGVKSSQIENINLLAKEFYKKGMEALDELDFVEALRNLRIAINLIPSYVRAMHNSLAQAIVPLEDWDKFIFAMQLIRLIDPDYEMARENLAIAYLNYGVQEAKNGKYEESLRLFHCALGVETSQEIITLVRENIAASHTALGGKAFREGDMKTTLESFAAAHFIASNELTRTNLSKAHFHLANSFANAGDMRGAIINYQRAEDSGLMWPEVLNNHACALAEVNEYVGAIMLLEAAHSMAPEDNIIKVNLSKLLNVTQGSALNLEPAMGNFITENVEIDFLIPPMKVVSLRTSA